MADIKAQDSLVFRVPLPSRQLCGFIALRQIHCNSQGLAVVTFNQSSVDTITQEVRPSEFIDGGWAL